MGYALSIYHIIIILHKGGGRMPERTPGQDGDHSPDYERIYAAVNWGTLSDEDRLGFILGDGDAEAWYSQPYLDVLMRFRQVPEVWGRIIVVWQKMHLRPRDLEAAVDKRLLMQAVSSNGTGPHYPVPTTATALLAKTFPPLRCFVDELLAEGFTILAGKPKKGKPYLALDMSLAIAVGRQAFMKFPTEKAKVLYISLEDGERRLQRRLLQMQSNLRTPEGLDFLYDFPRLGDGALEALTHYAQHYQVIIVDTIGRILPTQTQARKSLSEYQELTDVLGPIQQLALDKRAAIVMIDHLRKASADDDLDAIMGSQGKAGAADHALIYSRKGEEKDGVLKVFSRDLETDKIVLTLVDGHLEFLGKGEVYELDSEQNKIIRILEEEARPMAIPDIMKAMGIQADTHYKRFRVVMHRLYADDRIGRTKRGLYRLYGDDREEGVPF
jgi:hypothetical protein